MINLFARDSICGNLVPNKRVWLKWLLNEMLSFSIISTDDLKTFSKPTFMKSVCSTIINQSSFLKLFLV